MKKIKKLEGEGNHYSVPKLYAINSIKKQTEDEYLLRFDVPLEHEPAQFIQVSLLGHGEAPISICSFQDEYFEMSIRAVGNLTRKLCALKKGDKVGLRGPYGKGYPMESLKGNNVLVIGGGCGVAPMRSAIQYLERHRSDFGDVALYFGYRNPKEVLFAEDFNKWKKTFRVHVTVDKAPKSWKGEVGLITELLQKDSFDNTNKVAFVCGPPVMIKFVIALLKERGFNDDQIFLSHERMMKCATGMCGHCMIEGVYTCKDGPVFRYDGVKDLHG
ncbi:MAG: FAD/NAD(P)-binding protein [Candidatus Woesearchaeota archaeon]|nr:MAG: FAD/NAD(P)-binding protein [Candidatus Woesearchaeota archaeon]